MEFFETKEAFSGLYMFTDLFSGFFRFLGIIRHFTGFNLFKMFLSSFWPF